MTFVVFIGLQIISCVGGWIPLCTELETVSMFIIYSVHVFVSVCDRTHALLVQLCKSFQWNKTFNLHIGVKCLAECFK